jgi:Xaa-Pro aminopeptidase
MERAGLDALLITFLPNLYYLAGYNTYAVSVITLIDGGMIMLFDGRQRPRGKAPARKHRR